MTVASMITLARIMLIPAFLWMMSSPFSFARVVAFILFAIASLTDAVDGYVARRMNQVTNFGKFIDPLADKLLVTSALLMFIQSGEMSAIAAMIIITREFLVTSLRMVAVTEGRVIAAGFSGKVKTVVQIAGILFLLWGTDGALVGDIHAGLIVQWLMAAVTVWSGAVYFVHNSDVLKNAQKGR